MLNYKWTFYAFLLLDLLQKKIKIKDASPPQQRLPAYPQCLSASSQTPSSAESQYWDATRLGRGLSEQENTAGQREHTDNVQDPECLFAISIFFADKVTGSAPARGTLTV